MIRPTSWVTVARFDTMPEAHIALGRLRAAGLSCNLMDEHLVQTDWLYSIAVGGIKLRVQQADLERAIAELELDYSDIAEDEAD